jgi:chromatin segregation and condensation protein Rec8/ScpA/Scc1 (kleisin family)
MKRVPKRQVTLDELVIALRKALDVKEKRTERTQIARRQLEDIAQEDVTKKIEATMKEIEDILEKMDKVEFSKIVKEWKRDKIVEKFIPLLHLEHDRRVVCEQEDYFKEILVSRASSQNK